MPEMVELQLMVPECLGPADHVIEEVKRRVFEVEHAKAAERRRTGKRVLGRRAVLQQRWADAPTTAATRRTLIPRVAARNLWARVEGLLRNREFADDYARARAAWVAGLDVVFPVGTYWLRRFANVSIAVG